MLSHKTKYAFKAQFVMSEEYGRGSRLIAEIAEHSSTATSPNGSLT
jgi:hypothetical protein